MRVQVDTREMGEAECTVGHRISNTRAGRLEGNIVAVQHIRGLGEDVDTNRGEYPAG